MTRELSTRILVGLSVLYGVSIAVLAALDIAVAPAAMIGAVVLGALWVVRGLVFRHR